MNRYTIVFDVGGTEIRSAIVSESGNVLEKTARVYPAYSNQSRHFLLDYLYELIKKQAAIISGSDLISGIGYVFQGPCDLDSGICYIREQKKFESLYGVSVIDAMRDRLVADTRLMPRMASDYRIFFDQDTTWASLQPRELMHVGG